MEHPDSHLNRCAFRMKWSDKVEAMKHTYKKLKLSCLVVLGGNGSHCRRSQYAREEGLNVVSLPKTIDNDLWGDRCLNFDLQSAVDAANHAIDCIHTTASFPRKSFFIVVRGT